MAKIGFMPCRNSLKQFQEWDLNYISSKVAPSDSFVFFRIKIKNSNTCLRMKNRFIHWVIYFYLIVKNIMKMVICYH